MNESDLLAEIQSDLSACTGEGQTEVSQDREKALKYYLSEPYGNEEKGRSQIVTSEVADTIESMLPQILKPFISHENVVYFEPVGPEDEEAAKQETAYLNHVFYKENDGISILYAYCKDGLLSKNGIVKYYWEEVEEVTTESYTGIDEMTLTRILMEEDAEVVESTERTEEVIDPVAGPAFVTTYDIKVRRKETVGRAAVKVIPPEEFKIRPEWAELCLQDVPFCAHERDMYVSDLIAMGIPKADLYDISGTTNDSLDSEKTMRFTDTAELNMADGNGSDWTMRTVQYSECYKRVDYDGDGFAELRKICVVNGTNIVSNDPIDYVPFESWTPVPMTHRFFGRSAADQVMDLQIQKSTLVRNIMDNLYQANNVRLGVVDGEVSIEDLLDNTPGGFVRMTAPGMVQPLTAPMLTGHPYSMLEYLDSIKENRTGVTRYNQGIDADSLNKTASGINRIMDASAQRLQMVATLFGESVKRLMLGLHKLILQNQDKSKVISLRGRWVEVDPTEWRKRTNMTVVVGLGTGEQDKKLQYLMTILGLQEKALAQGLPLTSLDKVYNTLAKMVEAANLKEPSVFWTDPQGAQMPQRENPEVKLVEAQVAASSQQTQVKAQENQQDYDINLRKLQLDERRVALEERKVALEELRAGIEMRNSTIDSEIAASQAEMEAISAAKQ